MKLLFWIITLTCGLYGDEINDLSIDYNDLITINKGLEVEIGRTVTVDAGRHLKFNIRNPDEDRCVVRVVYDSHLTSWIGKLTPSEFPCNFATGDVIYTHYGGRVATSDRVQLLLRYDSSDDTTILPFMLSVKVLTRSKSTLGHQKSLLTVDQLGGYSQLIDSKILDINYDTERYYDCQIGLHKGRGIIFPRYGQLQIVSDRVDIDENTLFYTCEQFIDGLAYYQHNYNATNSNVPLNKDYLPMVIELKDWLNDGETVQHHLQLAVHIEGGVDNTSPKVSENSLLLMDVNQFVLTPLTPEILAAVDAETSNDELIFRLISPSNQSRLDVEGQLVSTDDQHMVIHSFTQKDVERLKIAYRPPSFNLETRRIIPIGLEVVDADGLSSEPVTLLVNVNPMNTKAPFATRNTGLSLFEGQSRRLYSTKNLEVSDSDNLDDVIIHVINGLHHGRLLLIDSDIKQFSSADLDAGLIRYQHDGSESYVDNIVFRLTDGHPNHTVDFLFTITIFPVDDQSPFLVVNTGLTLHKNLEAEIGPFVLSAADVDSENEEEITFLLSEPGPRYGQIYLKYEDPETEEKSVFAAREWSQNDIMEGQLYYRHLGQHHTQVVMDAINFRLKDNCDPPNYSKEHQFLVKILPLDDIPPHPHPHSTFTMTVSESELTEFGPENLSYIDEDSDDRYLRYTVVTEPFDLDQNNKNNNTGQIVLSENPQHQVTTFNQLQINHRKIAYLPPPAELGLAPRVIRMELDVEDEAGNIASGQTFDIVLLPINNKPPTVYNAGLKIIEGGSASIDTNVIDATDIDTDQYHLKFRLISGPFHGYIYHNSSFMKAGDNFSRVELSAGNLRYTHNGDDDSEDKMELEVSDGIHVVPFTVRIKVRNVDDDKLIVHSRNVTVTLSCNEGGAVVIDSEMVSSATAIKPSRKLTYSLDKIPTFGQLQYSGASVTRFTHQQLQLGHVIYRHTAGEIGQNSVTDNFTLFFSIGANGARKMINLSVSIEPVDNQKPNVTIVQPLIVNEGGKMAFNSDICLIEDLDSDGNYIICTITAQPTKGYLENTAPLPGSERSRTGLTITAFRANDIYRSTVNYVQSIHWNDEPKFDSFAIECSDGINVSPRVTTNVVISPVNDEIPKINVGNFEVLEGMPLHIDESILNAVDADEPADSLMFYIIRKPRHGRLVLQSADGASDVTSFSINRLLFNSDPTLAYFHDDSETIEDDFELELNDGDDQHNIRKVIKITIISTDDETPTLAKNRGLELKLGQAKIITNRILKAIDIDSDDQQLLYIITMAPRHGQLVKLSQIDNRNAINLTINDNFTQLDIDMGLISYVNQREHGPGRDLFKFDVTDTINYLIDRYFYVTIDGGNVLYPDVVSRGVELEEGGRVTLTTDILSTSDIDSDDRLLSFTVTRTPTHGHLETTDHKDEPIVKFSQLDLAGNKIIYIHTSDDEVKTDSFEFEVSDGYNSVYRTFRISVNQVDNKKPVIYMADQLTVIEGGRVTITPFELKAEDRDTDEEQIRFRVVQPPLHGQLWLNGSRPIVTGFTMADINAGRVTYQHDGSETDNDVITLLVTDGIHEDFLVYPDVEMETNKPVMLTMNIIPTDDQHPQLIVNKPTTTIDYISELGNVLGVRLSNKILQASDTDSPQKEIVYVITGKPKHGQLLHKLYGNKSLENFTQGYLDDGNILYVLNAGENSTDDLFYFKLVDKGGNENGNHACRLNWSWIYMESDTYTVNETEPFVKIFLNRRGFLGETSFVGVEIANVTAYKNQDFRSVFVRQVQFNPGQSRAAWKLPLIDDGVWEGVEQLMVILKDPVMAALDMDRSSSLIDIIDDEDASVVTLTEEQIIINENDGEISVNIERKGDLNSELSVICITQSGTAVGTESEIISSYSDFVSLSTNNIVHFEPNQNKSTCQVIIIDDSLFEMEEYFYIKLHLVSGGQIGHRNATKVIIKQDITDVPSISFEEKNYLVSESVGNFKISIIRSGPDLQHKSSVLIHSRAISATASRDYFGITRIVEFNSGSSTQIIQLTVLDDIGQPVLEGLETFRLILKSPINATIGNLNETIITIDDSIEDYPTVEFLQTQYVAEESDGEVRAIIERKGDLRNNQSIRCYTKQSTATVEDDFIERPNTDGSVIWFLPGESQKACVVILVNNDNYEADEQFDLVLSQTSFGSGPVIGGKNLTTITVTDSTDKTVVGFDKSQYYTKQPKEIGQLSIVEVVITRQGDISITSTFRVHTKDGSATSGKDYNGLSKDIKMNPNTSQVVIPVEILYDNEKENRETFIIYLKLINDDTQHTNLMEFKNTKAIVYIEPDDNIADVTFPSKPIIISLRDYDSTIRKHHIKSSEEIIAGYPVICITSCNNRHPEFSKTGSLCSRQGVNDSLTEFRWKVTDINNDLVELSSPTFFTSVNKIVLDAIYLTPGNRLQCVARAFNIEGSPGVALTSLQVKISETKGICPSRIAGVFGAEPFATNLRYIGSSDPEHPNMIKLSITIPHQDGLLPLISTSPLYSFQSIIGQQSNIRSVTHPCSNLLDYMEVQGTGTGFITNSIKGDNIEESEPYQFSSDLRTGQTLRFYRSLDLEACTWRFESYYNMSSLVNMCGGKIVNNRNGQIRNETQSYVSVHVPLHVSYAFFSQMVPGGWQHTDHVSQLHLKFVYDTSAVWREGITAVSDHSQLQATLYPTSMRIEEKGRLQVNFVTETKFHGQFLLKHSDGTLYSTVTSINHPDLTFTILKSENDDDESKRQRWMFYSNYSVKDYSGMYQIKLIPCVYLSSTPICIPRDSINFDLNVRFQQISDPVASEYTLSTKFYLGRRIDNFEDDTELSFQPDDTIYGRLAVDPIQNLESSFQLEIEKCLVCCGIIGFIPKYDPSEGEFGCLTRSPNIMHILKIIDTNFPETVDNSFQNVPLNASLSTSDESDQFRLNGFQFSAAPLFLASSGHQWFVHCVFMLKSPKRQRRNALMSLSVNDSDDGPWDIGKNGKGTNMHALNLNYQWNEPLQWTKDSVWLSGKVISLAITTLILVIIFVITIVIFAKRHCHKTSQNNRLKRDNVTLDNSGLVNVNTEV
ncbi:hypothetical protein CHUAL_006715 [Chamberlinius hualienensis]